MHITLEEQTVRIGAKLLADLQLLEKQTPFSYSEIARKAVRKYRRLRPDLSGVEVDSTYTGTVLRLELEQSLDPEDLREILTWYISLHDLSKPFTQLPSTHLREGVDYFIRWVYSCLCSGSYLRMVAKIRSL